MREIKFRAWDKHNKTMHPDCYYGGDQKGVNEIIAMFAEDMVWMQYTGLKDRNSKNIFEGDILRHFKSDDYLATVIWKNNGWCIKWQKPNLRVERSNDMDEPILRNSHIDSEVIGNIYENPDLLT